MAFLRGCAFVFLSLASCTNTPEDVPSTVITSDPESVCAGDAYRTSISLSAKQSAPHLTLVATKPDPNEPPLAFTWSFTGAPIQIVTGDAHTPTVVVQTTGDRPLEVNLHVVNGEGGGADAIHTISVTPVDENGNCPLAEK